MKQITYTNIIILKSGEVAFKDLSKKQQEDIGNYMRKTPLLQFGEVRERPPV